MADVQLVFDVFTFFLALFLLVVFVAVLVPEMNQRSITARVDSNQRFMQNQELALAFMRDAGSKGETTFELLTTYYSLQDGEEYRSIERNEVPGEIQARVKTYRSGAGGAIPGGVGILGVEGIVDDRTTGIPMPVPAASGEVKDVWLWG